MTLLLIKKRIRLIFTCALSLIIINTQAHLPNDFVDLHTVAPQIKYSIRYAGYHNFIGRPVTGYLAPRCLLTKPAALALAKVENRLLQFSLSLMVYDCYRPKQAVDDFIAWSKNPKDQRMKLEFYPRVNKKDLFQLGYVAAQSSHSRGSTVDLTIIPISEFKGDTYKHDQKLVACHAPYVERFQDGSIDMGTGYDCMDVFSHPANTEINKMAHLNRQLLQKIMTQNGFQPYDKEWWHFTLKNEPFPDTYFNFPITASNDAEKTVNLSNGLDLTNFNKCQALLHQCPAAGPFINEACVTRQITMHPICEQLKQLSKITGVSASLIEAKRMNNLDLITLNYPADGQTDYYIVTPTGRLIHTTIDPRTLSTQLSKTFAKQSWMIVAWGKPAFSKQSVLATLRITKECLACEVVGWARLRFDFDTQGHYVEAHLIDFNKKNLS